MKPCGFTPSSSRGAVVLGTCRSRAAGSRREDAELPSSSRGGHAARWRPPSPVAAAAAHAVGRERWAELMVIKKTNPIPSGIFTPCRSGRKADFFFLQFHLLQAERLLYGAGSPVLQLVRAQCCLNCLFDNCSGCKNRGFCGEFTQGCLQLPPSFILQYYSLPSRRYS